MQDSNVFGSIKKILQKEMVPFSYYETQTLLFPYFSKDSHSS